MFIQKNVVPNNSSWMRDLRFSKPNVQINQITMPGSHEAGMYYTSHCTSIVHSEWSITQSSSIYNQLRAGSRYFDLRVYSLL